MRWGILVVFAGLSAADYWSTYLALKAGGRERNGIVVRVSRRFGVPGLVALKALPLMLFTATLWGPNVRIEFLLAGCGINAVAVGINLHVWRRLRRRIDLGALRDGLRARLARLTHARSEAMAEGAPVARINREVRGVRKTLKRVDRTSKLLRRVSRNTKRAQRR